MASLSTSLLLLWTLMLQLWLLTQESVAAGASKSSFKYTTHADSTDQYVLALAEYDFRGGGFIDLSLDISLDLAAGQSDQGRTMLFLLICDAAAIAMIDNPPLSGTGSILNSWPGPSYCSMANRTLGDLCTSFPLPDDNSMPNAYHALFYMASTLQTINLAGADTLYLLIDACEAVGGERGVLRSCLAKPQSSSGPCFKCPLNNPWVSNSNTSSAHCEIPSAVEPSIHLDAAMNLCSSQGDCLGSTPRFELLVYVVLAIVWALTTVIWTVHINAMQDAVVELQQKLKLVPITQFVYTGITCVQLALTSILAGTALNVVQNGAILAQLVAMAISAEVLILIAKGWKITRESLQVREHQWIRFVTLLWATACIMLKTSSAASVAVFLVWGVTWAAIVFMIWYNSAFNMNTLRYQIAMVRQLAIDPATTPAFTKYMLFRRFRVLLGIYLALSCALGIVSMTNDSTADPNLQVSSSAADDVLTLLLSVTLGYTFRCRRFSRLMRASFAPVDPRSSSQPPSPHRLSVVAPAPADEDQADPNPSSPTKMVLVLNPDDAQLLGTAFQPPTTSSPVKKSAPEQ